MTNLLDLKASGVYGGLRGMANLTDFDTQAEIMRKYSSVCCSLKQLTRPFSVPIHFLSQ